MHRIWDVFHNKVPIDKLYSGHVEFINGKQFYAHIVRQVSLFSVVFFRPPVKHTYVNWKFGTLCVTCSSAHLDLVKCTPDSTYQVIPLTAIAVQN